MLPHWKMFPFVCVLVCAAALGGSGSMTKPLVGLRSEDPGVREAAERQILESHKETVIALESLIEENLRGDYMNEIMRSNDKGDRIDPKYLSAASAINLLGEFRSIHSIPVLVRHIKFDLTLATTMWRRSFGLEAYPAASALSKIGLPALGMVIEEYKAHGESLQFLLAARILKAVISEKELRTAYVTHLIASEKDPQKRERLERLLPPQED